MFSKYQLSYWDIMEKHYHDWLRSHRAELMCIDRAEFVDSANADNHLRAMKGALDTLIRRGELISYSEEYSPHTFSVMVRLKWRDTDDWYKSTGSIRTVRASTLHIERSGER